MAQIPLDLSPPDSDESGADTPRPKSRSKDPAKQLHDALAPFVNVKKLRELVRSGTDLREALLTDEAPQELTDTLSVLSALLRPTKREQIKSPADIAALLLVEMGHLDQEEMRIVILDTKSRILDIVMLYRGSVNSAIIRVGEAFKTAARKNATAIIIVHNHPSGDPNPSPEDVLVTRQLVEAGKLLDIDVLDHIIIGHGRYISMKERGLGFST